MSFNPYQSPHDASQPAVAPQEWLRRLIWPVWVVGTALIVGSWIDLVSVQVGWIGFAIAVGSSLLSYVLPGEAAGEQAEAAVLTNHMLQARDRNYYLALEAFRRGETLFYEGMSFQIMGQRVGCALVASGSPERIDEMRATQEMRRATDTFEMLMGRSPEFSATVVGKGLEISLVSDYGQRGVELFRLSDGRLTRNVA